MAMIRKISSLENFGLFHEFEWNSKLEPFRKFNLIYGWNRSGKTTISRVFSSCEKKLTYDEEEFKQYPKNGYFKITTDGDDIESSKIVNCSLPIKIFNQDFIDDNVSFDPSKSCKSILYLGEEDIKSENKLKQLEENKPIFDNELKNATKDKQSKTKIKDEFLTGLGREIANVLFDKNYNKTKAKQKIMDIGVDNFEDKKLEDDTRQEYEEVSKSKAKSKLSFLSQLELDFFINTKHINSFEKIFSVIKSLLERKVISETLKRLEDDCVLNDWVKQGFDLYKTKEKKETCLFCQKPLDNDFLSSLTKHFSKDYENLQNTIDKLKIEITKLKKKKIAVKQIDLYPDLIEGYEKQANKLNEIIEKLNAYLENALFALEKKHKNPLSIVVFSENPTDFLVSYNAIVCKIKKIFFGHNVKVEDHPKEVENAKTKLELHTIAVALLAKDYKKMELELTKAKKAEEAAKTKVVENMRYIDKLKEAISSIERPIEKINNFLHAFFGKEEIKLELDQDKKGYLIKRCEIVAKNLSESEKTAIAFSYFIVKVEEKRFDLKKAIIFIDDPISSFDSNFIYHCFSLIKAHFGITEQLFISTHNFQFFNLVKKWFIGKNKQKITKNKKKENPEENPEVCEFYMIENYFNGGRFAKIVSLDKALKDFNSEYHFLFNLLYRLKESENIKYKDLYTIGNIARRYIDIFLDFKIPDTINQKEKLEKLIKAIDGNEEKFSVTAKNSVYQLINDFSHNSDPTSGHEHRNATEILAAIEILLKIVKESDPIHFNLLIKSIVNNDLKQVKLLIDE